MKKLITIVLLLALAAPVFAQDYDFQEKWTVKANVGYLPTVPVLVDIFGGLFAGIAIGLNKDANETLDFELPPYFSIEGLYHFNEDWSVGLGVGYCSTVFKVVDKDDKSIVKSRSYINFIPITVEGRMNYLNRPAVKLYGSIEAGAFLSVQDKLQVVPDFQINPIGVEFGRRFFGTVELGIGLNYTGVRGGIGYRF